MITVRHWLGIDTGIANMAAWVVIDGYGQPLHQKVHRQVSALKRFLDFCDGDPCTWSAMIPDTRASLCREYVQIAGDITSFAADYGCQVGIEDFGFDRMSASGMTPVGRYIQGDIVEAGTPFALLPLPFFLDVLTRKWRSSGLPDPIVDHTPGNSQRCPLCGKSRPGNLMGREYRCPTCMKGPMDADLVAAWNVALNTYRGQVHKVTSAQSYRRKEREWNL